MRVSHAWKSLFHSCSSQVQRDVVGHESADLRKRAEPLRSLLPFEKNLRPERIVGEIYPRGDEPVAYARLVTGEPATVSS